MNCREALDTLEAVEVGAIPATEPAVREAERHRAACAACQVAWPVRQQWAHRLTDAMSQVPIPAGLRERLQESVTAISPAAVVAQPRQWRRVWGSVAAIALLMLIAAGVSWWLKPPVQLSEQELLAAMTAELEPATEFTGPFVPRLPDLWNRIYEFNPRLVRGFPRGDHPAAGAVALIPFQFQSSDRHPTVRGRLLILHRRQFGRVPAANSFGTAGIYYQPQGAYAMWMEGNLIFICLVPSGPADLQRFQEQLTQSRPVT